MAVIIHTWYSIFAISRKMNDNIALKNSYKLYFLVQFIYYLYYVVFGCNGLNFCSFLFQDLLVTLWFVKIWQMFPHMLIIAAEDFKTTTWNTFNHCIKFVDCPSIVINSCLHLKLLGHLRPYTQITWILI